LDRDSSDGEEDTVEEESVKLEDGEQESLDEKTS